MTIYYLFTTSDHMDFIVEINIGNRYYLVWKGRGSIPNLLKELIKMITLIVDSKIIKITKNYYNLFLSYRPSKIFILRCYFNHYFKKNLNITTISDIKEDDIPTFTNYGSKT